MLRSFGYWALSACAIVALTLGAAALLLAIYSFYGAIVEPGEGSSLIVGMTAVVCGAIGVTVAYVFWLVRPSRY